MLTTAHVRAQIENLLERHPDQTGYVRPLQDLMEEGADVLSRKEFRGHVTCGALVVNPQGQLLVIRHNALGRWLTPGGHVERDDASLYHSALRELQEEVGLEASALWVPAGSLSLPMQIDQHGIPANPRKDEPAHDHWDFRYLFLLRDPGTFQLQLEEVSAVRWEPLDQVEPRIAELLRQLL